MEENRKASSGRWLFFIAGFLLAVLSTLPWFLWREEIVRFSELGYFGLSVACFLGTAVVLMPSSTTLMIVVASTVLDPALCILMGTIGAVLGEMVSYLCGNLGAKALPPDSRLLVLINRLSKRPEWMVFIFAVLPMPFFDLAGFAAGAQKMPWWRYTLAVFLARLIKYIVAILSTLVLLPWLGTHTDGLVQELIRLLTTMIGIPSTP